MDCTLALYKKDKINIREKCSLEISSPHEVIIQLNSTSFYTYTTNQTDLFINCPKNKQEKNRIIGFNIINLQPGCFHNIYTQHPTRTSITPFAHGLNLLVCIHCIFKHCHYLIHYSREEFFCIIRS